MAELCGIVRKKRCHNSTAGGQRQSARTGSGVPAKMVDRAEGMPALMAAAAPRAGPRRLSDGKTEVPIGPVPNWA